MPHIAIKLCGLSTQASVKKAVALKADYIGFVFHPASPRNISPENAANLITLIPSTIKKVAVVVNPSDDVLEEIIDHVEPDYFQLHGDESVERVTYIKQTFGVPIIKAFSIETADDFSACASYAESCELFLFDAKAPKDATIPGGNGKSFDWTLLAGQTIAKPWVLSGGLTSATILHAIDSTGAQIVDVSSGIELEKGVKDLALMHEFVNKITAH